MMHEPGFCLTRLDRILLTMVGKVVPASERTDWGRTWEAELWHRRNHRGGKAKPVAGIADFTIGVLLDGFWLRMENWRCLLSGTAGLSIGILLGLNLLAVAVVFVLQGGGQLLSQAFTEDFRRSLMAAPLIACVALVTNYSRHRQMSSRKNSALARGLFSCMRMTHVLLLAFLTSINVCLPIHRVFPVASYLLQLLCYTIFALFGLRWAICDQERRCKQCLRCLTPLARIGRPSRNLLEWNGIKLACRKGHGQLSIPEIETSWCESSHWSDLDVI